MIKKNIKKSIITVISIAGTSVFIVALILLISGWNVMSNSDSDNDTSNNPEVELLLTTSEVSSESEGNVNVDSGDYLYSGSDEPEDYIIAEEVCNNYTDQEISVGQAESIDDVYTEEIEVDDYTESPMVLVGHDAIVELDSKKVTDSGLYECVANSTNISVFAEEITDCFTIANGWCQYYSSASFNVRSYNELTLCAGMMDREYMDNAKVRFYLDGSENPCREVTLVRGTAPQELTLDLENASSLTIEVESDSETVVFFDIEVSRL